MFKCVKVGVKCSCVGGTTPASGFIKEKDQSGLENGFLSENKKGCLGEVKFKSSLMPIKVRSFQLIIWASYGENHAGPGGGLVFLDDLGVY